MNVVLTQAAARELGRALRFMRHARAMTLAATARAASLSPQYVHNIERGERTTVSEDALLRMTGALGVPEGVVADLVLRARLQSALEQRGLDAEQVKFVWRGVEQRLVEVGFDVRVDLGKVVTDIIADPGTPAATDEQQKNTRRRKALVHTGKSGNRL